MAAAKSSHNLLVLTLLLFLSCYGSLADTIDDICNQAININLCNNVLRAPRNRSPDLTRCGMVAIQEEEGVAGDFKQLLYSYLSSDKEVELRQRYDDCLKYIDLALEKVSNGKNYLNAKQYGNFSSEIKQAGDIVWNCGERVYYDFTPHRDLYDSYDKLQNTNNVVLIIAGMLNNWKS